MMPVGPCWTWEGKTGKYLFKRAVKGGAVPCGWCRWCGAGAGGAHRTKDSGWGEDTKPPTGVKHQHLKFTPSAATGTRASTSFKKRLEMFQRGLGAKCLARAEDKEVEGHRKQHLLGRSASEYIAF